MPAFQRFLDTFSFSHIKVNVWAKSKTQIFLHHFKHRKYPLTLADIKEQQGVPK